MLRAKILKIGSSISLKEAKNLLLQADYTEEAGRGILLSEVTSSEICGRYFEKNTYIEEIFHPINGVTEVERYNFSDISFSIDFEIGLIALYSNLTKRNNFITFLGMCLDFKLSIAELRVDLSKLVEAIKVDIAQINIKKITYSSIQIDSTTKAFVAISSTGDASRGKDLLPLVTNQIPSRLNFEGIYKNRRVSCSVSSNGSIAVTNNHPDEILSIIKSRLNNPSKG